MKYTRLFSDEEGETHFEDFDIDLEPVDYATPMNPHGYPTTSYPQ